MQNNSGNQYKQENDWQGSSPAGKDLGITVKAVWICIQQCTSIVYKQNLTLSYNRSSMSDRCSEVITSLCSELVRLNIECWVQFWIPRGLWESGDKATILGGACDLWEGIKVLWGLLVQYLIHDS